MRGRLGQISGAVVASGLVLSGCAHFDDRAAGQTFQPAPELSAAAGPQPSLPEIDGSSRSGTARPGPTSTSIPPPQGCTDYDKAVIATCLDTVSAVAALPGDTSEPSALAAERKSGRVLQVAAGSAATEIARLTVDAGSDGGLTGLALSPRYTEDQLVFAYITTAADNRVVRFAKGQQPKPILTGIPKGTTGNRGAIMSDGTALLVATGDAGDAASAANPNSLAGKVLRIDTAGNPAPGNPTAGSRVYASGLHTPGGLCKSSDGARIWVTDREPDRDAVYKIQPGTSLSVPAWTWADKPGLAGCVDGSQLLLIGASIAGNIQNLPITPDGSVGGVPKATMDGKSGRSFGRLAGMDMLNSQYALAGTVNRDGGQPVSSDDRVVVVQIQPSPDGGSGKD